MKRVVVGLIGLFAVSMLLSGCGQTLSTPVATPAPAAVVAAPVEVKPVVPVYRTWLGIGMGVIADEDRGTLPLPPGAGLIVTQVMNDSPAAKAGIQENDILVKFNDQLLIYPFQLRSLVRLGKPAEVAVMTVLREGKETKINVTLDKEEVAYYNADETPVEEEIEKLPEGDYAWLGVGPASLEDYERSNTKLAPGTGIIVRAVIEDGPALKAGVQENDILVKYNDQLLTYPVQLRRLVKINKPGDTVTLSVLRDGKDMEIKVTLGKISSKELQPPEEQ